MKHHHLEDNDAQIAEDRMGTIRTSYRVYRPDGLYAKMVMSFTTREAAVEYCEENGWRIR